MSNTGTYSVKLFGKPAIEVRVAEELDIINIGIDELKNHLNGKPKVVGVKVWGLYGTITALQLCVDTYCLVIQFRKSGESRCQKLKEFVMDPSICFVIDENIKIYDLICNYGVKIKCVALGELASRALNKPHLLREKRLDVLANEAELNISFAPTIFPALWDGKFFNPEYIRYGMLDVFASYLIGCKFMSMVS